ncbi:ShlB/FhaC/HecB family hemolysin secretion/activation protein [Luteibacter pinisoli]|uniref:ShlB/FhaC/HecB family hemolysin secretion/activation protein n=1 Tax=Luteibacter pinisoli TaxID=2589080 RepID=A0A4Y5Z4H7_9GAMM|nr:ShlB/FhaC/HecB family hemolysin secretion/activation protein [Luteibacter pinisoli]QDE40014.1 ShlB/FhaC/HecB family hemolysin secretion/activation protein [Luteibacter pinisoli]
MKRAANPLAKALVIAIALGITAQAAAQDAPQAFDVNEYVVDGNTTLQPVDIETAVYPFLGPGKSMNDVSGARDALQKVYQAHGYQSVVVDIPPQQVKEGVIRLQVTENTIGHVRVEGATYRSPKDIREGVPALAEGGVPDFSAAQQQLTDVNRRAGAQVVPVLTPGKLPNTMDVTLKVNDNKPLTTSLEVNNDHSVNTPELRTVASVRDDNLFQKGQAASLTYIVAPQDRHSSEVWAGSYLIPFNGDWSMLASGYKSNSNANAVGGTTVLGKGNAFGFTFVRTLPTHGEYSQSLSLGVNRKHFDQNLVLGEETSKSPITYIPVSVTYQGQRMGEKSMSTVSLGGVAGFRAGGSSAAEFDNQRYQAKQNFFYVKAEGGHTRNFDNGWSLVGRLALQLSTSSLVSSEQFAAGGESTVRGYLEAEETADHGAIGSVELRTPSLAAHVGSWVNDWRFLAFADGAHLQLMNALPQLIDAANPDSGSRTVKSYDLSSVGLGTRFQLFNIATGAFEIAYPFNDGQATKAHDTRIHFSLKAEL